MTIILFLSFLSQPNISFPSLPNNDTWLESLLSLRDYLKQEFNNDLGIQSIISQYGFDYESFSLPEPVVIATWFQPLLHLSANLVLVDIFWRIFQTFRLCYRFWKGTAIHIPPANLRKGKTSTLRSISSVIYAMIDTMMATTTLIWISVLFVICMIILILVTISGKLSFILSFKY